MYPRGTSTAARQAPPTRRQLVRRMADFIAAQISAVGGVTREALIIGGFAETEIDELDTEVRDVLRRRNLVQAA